MSQTFLDENPPMILDATCSDKRRWPKFASVRLDIRREVFPDIQADACCLPFRDRVFDAIYVDPPWVKDGGKESKALWELREAAPLGGRFGGFTKRNQFLKFIFGINCEFERCLKSEGRIHMKIGWHPSGSSNGSLLSKHGDIQYLSNFEVEQEIIRPSNLGWSDCMTSWLTMRPKP